MKIELENVKPRDIERRSFEIITEELGDRKLDPDKELIIKRCIHTSADFEYADSLCFLKMLWRKPWMRSARVPASSRIPRWADPASTNVPSPVTAERFTASCPMRMWQPQRRQTEPQEPPQAWTRQHSWTNPDLCHRQCADRSGTPLRTDRRGKTEPGTHHRRPGRLRQRGTVRPLPLCWCSGNGWPGTSAWTVALTALCDVLLFGMNCSTMRASVCSLC